MVKLFQIFVNWIVAKLRGLSHSQPSDVQPLEFTAVNSGEQLQPIEVPAKSQPSEPAPSNRDDHLPPAVASPQPQPPEPAPIDPDDRCVPTEGSPPAQVIHLADIYLPHEIEEILLLNIPEINLPSQLLQELRQARELLGPIEGHDLDNFQINCIRHDFYNHLVLAGAGTGKTTTVIGKVKYLLRTGQYTPEDILILSYTRSSADEMKSRILKETGESIYTCTFHKLGMDIIRQINPDLTVITDAEKKQTIQELVRYELHSPRFLDKLNLYARSSNGNFFVHDYILSKQDPLTDNEVDVLLQNNESFMAKFYDGCVKIIDRLRTNNTSPEQLRVKCQSSSNKFQTMHIALCDAIMPIYYGYSQYLNRWGKIDYADMINFATELIQTGAYQSRFRCVIVDEYQDISQPRFKLLAALRKSCDYRLFCVGDDWQSVYSFSGSDVDLIVNFDRYWHSACTSKIVHTHRFPQNLADLSGNFIMRNPYQVKKELLGVDQSDKQTVFEICKEMQEALVEALSTILLSLPAGKSVFLIGRYKKDIDLYRNLFQLISDEDKDSSVQELRFEVRPDLNITFLTAHKSKGLQADIVVILNNLDSNKAPRDRGFPAFSQYFSTIDFLLEPTVDFPHGDDFPHSEERRLFYVALTRAKERVFLFTLKGLESVFIQELRNDYGKKLSPDEHSFCPYCGLSLRLIDDPHDPLLACPRFHYHRSIDRRLIPF